MIKAVVSAVSEAGGRVVGSVSGHPDLLNLNFIRVLNAQMGTIAGSLLSIAGTWIPYSVTDMHLVADAGEGMDRRGIVVGSVDTPPTITQATLFGLYPHGTVAGRLFYRGVGFTPPLSHPGTVVFGTIDSFTISRIIQNLSPTPATIAEIGLYVICSPGTVMLDRTVLATPITVEVLGTVTVTYTFLATL